MKTIPLAKDLFAIVDDADFPMLNQHKWHLDSKGYAQHSITEHHKVLMHRLIIGPVPKGFVTDHINGNRLDNRRGNLRFVTQSANVRKSTGTGVYWHEKSQKWAISLKHQYKTLYFGLFDDREEAVAVAALLKGALLYHELTKGTENGQR